MGEPTYTSEYVEGALDVLRRHLLPRLFIKPPQAAAGVAGVLRPIRGHPMAKTALELAILDAEGRMAEQSLARHLGAVRTRVPSGVAIGVTGSITRLLDTVADRLSEGYRRVKLKIHPGWDIAPVRAVRQAFAELDLQVDGNGSYGPGDVGRLKDLDPFDLLLIEQPLPAEDLMGHARLGATLRTPICLDESITSADMARTAISLHACRIVNVKAGRVGGYLEAVRVHDVCKSFDVPVWCGGMLETGIGRAANLALAALPSFSLPGDLSASNRYYREDITEPVRLNADGTIDVPNRPGTGAIMRMDRLDAVTVGREWWPRRS
jgi:O-succinylbenzoate synthase